MTSQDAVTRKRMTEAAEELKNAGVCPTCRHFDTGNVYPDSAPRTFYEDDNVICMLEAYPRALGHAVVLVKSHYEDISELPPTIATTLWPIVRKAIHAIKTVLSAEKVYLCSMCDGKRNHFHLQLIPRFSDDDSTGSKRFVLPRGVLDGDYPKIVRELTEAMKA